LNTAYIERVNLTIRHGIAALARRTWATAQQTPRLLAHLEGGVLTIILCVLTHPYEWRLYSPESEVANVWHNAIASVPQRWQRGEPTIDGQREKFSVIPCRRYHAQPFEGH
jgi:hypothetical protein